MSQLRCWECGLMMSSCICRFVLWAERLSKNEWLPWQQRGLCLHCYLTPLPANSQSNHLHLLLTLTTDGILELFHVGTRPCVNLFNICRCPKHLETPENILRQSSGPHIKSPSIHPLCKLPILLRVVGGAGAVILQKVEHNLDRSPVYLRSIADMLKVSENCFQCFYCEMMEDKTFSWRFIMKFSVWETKGKSETWFKKLLKLQNKHSHRHYSPRWDPEF